MKIDLCLIASNDLEIFAQPWPLVYKAWKEVCGIEAKLIMVAEKIPEYLEDMCDTIILFKPIEDMHTGFQAQCIRLLYPALFDNKNIIVSDADIVPARREYFIESVRDFSDNNFITYRDAYINQQMYGLCYNLANSKTWGKVFSINNEDDIRSTLKKWYNNSYDGKKNCTGWFTDQKMLYKYLNEWTRKNDHILLKDIDLNFNRLDKRQRNFISHIDKKLIETIKKGGYTDFHLIRPYNKFKIKLNKIMKIVFDKNKI